MPQRRQKGRSTCKRAVGHSTIHPFQLSSHLFYLSSFAEGGGPAVAVAYSPPQDTNARVPHPSRTLRWVGCIHSTCHFAVVSKIKPRPAPTASSTPPQSQRCPLKPHPGSQTQSTPH